jgi:hypothetical protein
MVGSNGSGRELFARYLIEKKGFKRFTFAVDRVEDRVPEHGRGCFSSSICDEVKECKHYVNITRDRIVDCARHAVITDIKTMEELSTIKRLGAFIVFVVRYDVLRINGKDKIPDLRLRFNDLRHDFLYFRNFCDGIFSAWRQFEMFYEEMIESEYSEEDVVYNMDDDDSVTAEGGDYEELPSDE